jgi:hypothetical protein
VVSIRRKVLGAPAVAAHRLALALVRALPARRRRRRRAERPVVRIVLTNAHAMGGTVRASLTLAGHLARSHDVEVIAVKRGGRRRPFFPFPPGVQVTTLDDRRKPRRGPLERMLAGLPSLLVHPEDYAYPAASLWTDLKLLRALRATGGEIVIATRPAWALLAAAATATSTRSSSSRSPTAPTTASRSAIAWCRSPIPSRFRRAGPARRSTPRWSSGPAGSPARRGSTC